MNINNFKIRYGQHSKQLPLPNWKAKNNVEKNTNNLSFKDEINISTSAKKLAMESSFGKMNLDKGTASNTTLYVDRLTFEQIADYTTGNPECSWEEFGMDDNKRWIVVNGQRFESPLSEAEKEAIRRAKKGLLGMLNDGCANRQNHQSRLQETIKLSLDKNDRLKINTNVNLESSDKIENLMKNDTVMMILTNIAKKRAFRI